ncbi:MAG: cytochrome P450 [Actinomycetota bacterium]|nr:cytochrome P450 [Actinomycetota bacterium]
MLPPGPRLPAVVQAGMLARDPIGFLRRCHERYGDVFRIRFPGFPRFVYVADPALVRQVYAADRTVGRAGAARHDFLAPVVGHHSMLVTEGEEWLEHRKLLGPAFHRRVVDDYRETIAEIAAAEIERMPAGVPFAARPHMRAITLEVIMRLVFGLAEGPRLDRLRVLLGALLDAAGSPLLLLVPPRFFVFSVTRPRMRRVPGPLGRFLRAQAEADTLLFELIRERRAEGVEGRTDALSVMVEAGLGDQAIRDELHTLLQAGHETTATSLAWAFERLSRHPDVLDRLVREVRESDVDDYLRATVREVLRARPVIIDTPRLLEGPLELGDWTIPAGWVVAPSIPLVQGEPDLDPDREQDNSAWIPFGGGKRHCVGSHLALLELETVIAEVLRRRDIAPVDTPGEHVKMVHVTLAPAEQGTIVARPVATRAAAAAI